MGMDSSSAILALHDKRIIYSLLFQDGAETPRWLRPRYAKAMRPSRETSTRKLAARGFGPRRTLCSMQFSAQSNLIRSAPITPDLLMS